MKETYHLRRRLAAKLNPFFDGGKATTDSEHDPHDLQEPAPPTTSVRDEMIYRLPVGLAERITTSPETLRYPVEMVKKSDLSL